MYEQWAIFIEIYLYIFIFLYQHNKKDFTKKNTNPNTKGFCYFLNREKMFVDRKKRIQSVLNESLETFTFIRMNTDGQVHVLMGFQHPFSYFSLPFPVYINTNLILR